MIKFPFISNLIQVNKLLKNKHILLKERGVIRILEQMLATQEDKVANLKDLIEKHKKKEISTLETVKFLQAMVKNGAKNIEQHLDSLKDIADKVRTEELIRISDLTDNMQAGNELKFSDFEPLPEEDLEADEEPEIDFESEDDGPAIDFGSETLNIGGEIHGAKKIKNMKKIKSLKKIKSITVSFINI